ncbi:MAG: amidohydrolase family protein, partial [Acidobacteria bacterium]|nr:amidohydrolase family protein [Acidobacteriota bacterium]
MGPTWIGRRATHQAGQARAVSAIITVRKRPVAGRDPVFGRYPAGFPPATSSYGRSDDDRSVIWVERLVSWCSKAATWSHTLVSTMTELWRPRPLCLLVAALALFAACGGGGQTAAEPADDGTIVLIADRVLDGRGGVLEGHGVAVRDGRIVAVAAAAELPAGERHDFPGGTILPGLIDTHVHLSWHFGEDGKLARGAAPETAAMHAVENGIRMLEAGFTTVQSLGAAADGPVRDAVNRGVVPGPRIITTLGQLFAGTGGADELVAEVHRLADAGADAIKIFASESIRVGGGPTLTQEELDATCGAANERGLRTLVHAHGPVSATRASRAGCTTIEHGALLDQETLD